MGVARGRNIFPKEERRGRGGRVNNLFKRFQAQHRDKLGEPAGDLLYDGFDTVKSRRERISRTRTRSRSRGRGDRRSRKRRRRRKIRRRKRKKRRRILAKRKRRTKIPALIARKRRMKRVTVIGEDFQDKNKVEEQRQR